MQYIKAQYDNVFWRSTCCAYILKNWPFQFLIILKLQFMWASRQMSFEKSQGSIQEICLMCLPQCRSLEIVTPRNLIHSKKTISSPFNLYLNSVLVLSPAQCPHLALSGLKSRTPFARPLTQSITILLQCLTVMLVFYLPIAHTVVGEQSCVLGNVC